MPRLPLKFDAQGLVPVVVQDHLTGEIRMFAFATDVAVQKTLETGSATFWSRSRGELWQKGRGSSQETPVVRVLADCDADCLIYSSDPRSPSCNSGAQSCFFQCIEGGGTRQSSEQPQTVLAAVEAEIESSKKATDQGDDTKMLLDKGAPAVAAKICEDATQLAGAVKSESDEQVVLEAADMLFHVLVALQSRSISMRRVLDELARRPRGKRARVP